MHQIKILIADDHAIVRTGLSALFKTVDGFTVVGEADDGVAAVGKAQDLNPDIVVMDIMMPGKDGIDATAEIKHLRPETKVLILTTSTVSDDLAKAFAAGADNAITKSADNSDLIEAIKATARGDKWISPELTELMDEDPPVQNLTPRQIEILSSVTRGLTNADIARQLGISVQVVREHTMEIFSKLGAANRTEAVAIALRKHLLKI